MKIIKNKIGVDTIIYAETFEYEVYDQIKSLANYEPYLNEKIRVMPDAHAGKGCTVGTTMTITDKITPNLVGVDIGCGMLVSKLQDKEINLNKLDKVIKYHIPSGFSIRNKSITTFDFFNLRCAKHVDLKRAMLSIGTLGGGNHFIEVDQDDDGSLYLVIHSGSRNLGVNVCKHYQDKAWKNVNEMSHIKANLITELKKQGREKEIDSELKRLKKPKANKDLAHLEGNDFEDYINDMKIVQDYASLNREMMALVILKELGLSVSYRFQSIHNYIDITNMIMRKGAVSARDGETLLIPINMRDGALLCKGKGNPDWNYSAPHGAGRLMSRKKAKETISFQEYADTMKGIYSTSVVQDTIDEAPQAYKPMSEIIEATADTLEIIKVLKPIYNYKDH